MKTIGWVVLVALGATMSGARRPETLRIGQIELAVPSGWNGRVEGGRIILEADGTAEGSQAQIVVEPDMKPDPTMRAWFYALWDDAAAKESVSRKGLPSFSQTNTSKSFIAEATLPSGGRLVAAAYQTDAFRLLAWYRCSSADLLAKGRDILPELLKGVKSVGGPSEKPGDKGDKTGPGNPGERPKGDKTPGQTKPPNSTDEETIQGEFEPDVADMGALLLGVRKAPEGDVKPLVALVRAMGYSIVSADGKVVQPTTVKRIIQLPVTEAELSVYAELSHRGDQVSMSSLCAVLDHAHEALGITGHCANSIGARLRLLAASPRAGDRQFVKGLVGLAPSSGGDLLAFGGQKDVPIAPLQFLLMVRRVSLEFALVVARNRQAPGDEPSEADHGPRARRESAMGSDFPEWVQGAINLGLTVNFDVRAEAILDHELEHMMSGAEGKLGKASKGLDAANGILSILKFVAVYSALKGELEVESGGPPLKRTKSHREDEEKKTIKGTFSLDSKLLEAFKYRYQVLLTAVKVESSLPEAGPLKEKTVIWDLFGAKVGDEDPPVGWDRGGEPDWTKGFQPQHTVTESHGVAYAKLTGLRQKRELRDDVVPVHREVTVRASVRLKSNSMSEDMLDIAGSVWGILGLGGLKGGAASNPVFATVSALCELLYRIDWKFAGSVKVPIKDWDAPGTWIATVGVAVSAADSYQQGTGAGQPTIRTFRISHTYEASCDFTSAALINPGQDKLFEETEFKKTLERATGQYREMMLKSREFWLKNRGKTMLSYRKPVSDDIRFDDFERTDGWAGECGPPVKFWDLYTLKHPYDESKSCEVLKNMRVLIDTQNKRVQISIPNTAIPCWAERKSSFDTPQTKPTEGVVHQVVFPTRIVNPETDEYLYGDKAGYLIVAPLPAGMDLATAKKEGRDFTVSGRETRTATIEFDTASGKKSFPITYTVAWVLRCAN